MMATIIKSAIDPQDGTEDYNMTSDDRRLDDLKRRLGRVPKRVQRSIDRYRLSMGRKPLWSEADAVDRRRRPPSSC